MAHLRTVGIVLHPRRNSVEAIKAITDWARQRDVRVLGLAAEVGRIACDAVPVDPGQLAAECQLVVSLGGDGTALRTLRLVRASGTPVLGVNLGRLGFLAEIDVGELGDALTAVDEERCTLDVRAAVRARFAGTTAVAFNDVALVRTPGRGTAAVALRVDGCDFVRYAADAIIVATPTGSTAYSFSVGGPLVSPSAEGLVVTAAARHSAFNRSLFLTSADELVLEVLPPSGPLAIEVDGEVHGEVHPGDRVDVDLLPGAGRLVRLGRTTFYERARRKLRLLGSVEVE